ncbi:UNVERIFIED_CONTAM: F-box/kelch-repeat protein SKIP25 [Sesamum angustifolium]|uniref:F-box/kelch-repeat protein SKIP25 n=1 Tax=Sesamum angustifolium TaxID=2727405 RepID=A0AAW2N5D0_9LAMI
MVKTVIDYISLRGRGNSVVAKHTMSAAKRCCKNRDRVNENDENQQKHLEIESVLLPGLPNHLAQHCLSTLHPSLLYNVCMPWRRFLYSPCFPPFFSLYALLRPNSATAPSANCVRGHCQSHSVAFFCFEPISSKWRSLPSPPSDPPLCLLRRHPSFISRNLPIQSITASGRLVLIAANTHELLPALTRPLVFDPLSSKWNFGPPFLLLGGGVPPAQYMVWYTLRVVQAHSSTVMWQGPLRDGTCPRMKQVGIGKRWRH